MHKNVPKINGNLQIQIPLKFISGHVAATVPKNLVAVFFAGKNDGYVKGIRYFRCRTQHGVFVRHDKLIQDKKRKNVKPAKVPTNVRRSSGNLVPATGAHREKETSVSPANSGGPNVNAHQGSSSLMKPTAASSARHK